MVPGFSRSISLPLSPNHKAAKNVSHHVRSVSLPGRAHPLIFHLEEHIRAVRSCAACTNEATSTSVETALIQIEALQIALEDFLNLTQTQETLHGSESINLLLENFLFLADVFGSFLSTIVNLKQHQSEVQSAIRRGDKISLVGHLRSQRRVVKEISQLASSLKTTTKIRSLGFALNAMETEIVGILVEAISATSAASMAVFNGVVAMSASASTTKNSNSLTMLKKLSTLNSSIKNRGSDEFVALERLEELDMCIENVEPSCERVFRNLINSRVSLLNISSSSM